MWFDEEPPLDIYSEGLTRISATGVVVYVTLGSGRIFPVADETVACPSRDFPPEFTRIRGIDLGDKPDYPSAWFASEPARSRRT